MSNHIGNIYFKFPRVLVFELLVIIFAFYFNGFVQMTEDEKPVNYFLLR